MLGIDEIHLGDCEIWKPAVGYEDYLEVSNKGNARRKAHSFVKRNGRWCHVPSRVLKLNPTRTGYLLVNAKGRKAEQIHRLVALTFIPNPNNLAEVNHKDENKANNRVENLEWCSHKYNSSYGTRISRIKQTLKEKSRGKSVSQYTKEGELIRTYKSIREATKKTGINNIGICVRGNSKYAGGFVWIESSKSFEDWVKKVCSKIKDKEKTILQIDKNGNIVKEYRSESEVERITGIKKLIISRICRGKHRQFGDFIWKFKN